MTGKDDQEGLIFSQMRAMVSLMDRLRDFKLDELISLPKIAVLGMQSAGKSSLLEAVCGLNFLPRGSGIVTRRPLELRMTHKPIADPYFIFPGEFGDKSFKNPEDVRKGIEELTDRIAGTEKGVSPVPIILNVYGPNVPDLTVIDLPGITKIAVDKQTKDIETVTKELVRKYCGDPGVVILCVIPANIDITTSESLKFAMEIDPSGERTLGVLTKVDLMDQGTDASKILLNKEIPLKYGYVAVKGRSQKETLEKVPVSQALQAEIDFFAKHPSYSSLPSEVLGTRALVDRMSKILYRLISKSLPRIRDEISVKKQSAKQLIETLGSDFPEDDQSKMERVFQLVQAFHDYFCQELTGKLFDQSKLRKFGQGKNPKSSETIIYQFNQQANDLLSEYFNNGYRISDDYSDEYIQHAITTYQGENLPGFYSFDSFIFLINPKLQLLGTPTLTLLDEVKQQVEEKGLAIIDFFIGKYSALASACKDIFSKLCNQKKLETRKLLEKLTRCHENYFFTNDPALVDLSIETGNRQVNRKMTTAQMIILEMRARLDNYFRIVVRNLRDTVPKVIGSFFLKRLVDLAKTEMLQELNQRNYCLDAFKEGKGITEQRTRAKEELKALSKAEDVLTGEFGALFAESVKSGAQGPVAPESIGAPAVSTGLEEWTIEELANMNNDFLRVSYNQMRTVRGGTGYIPPAQQDYGQTPLKQIDRTDSVISSNDHALNDSGLRKRYTLGGQDNSARYILKDDAVSIPPTNFNRNPSEMSDPHSTRYSVSSNNVTNDFSTYNRTEPPTPKQTAERQAPSSNKFDYNLTSNGSSKQPSVQNQFAQAKDAYQTYETINKNFTKEEQKEIVKVGTEAYKYGQQNVTKEQAQTAFEYGKIGAKYVTDNFTKEQIIGGAKAVYEGGKYVANSSAGQKVIQGTKDMLTKPAEPAPAPQQPKKKTNLFGDFF